MAIRVALVGTGNAGRLALRQLIRDDPRFELVAVGVSTPEKAGKDAGELAGLEVATGITAVIGLDGVIAARLDCVVYTGDGRHPPDRIVQRLPPDSTRASMWSARPGGLQYPWG